MLDIEEFQKKRERIFEDKSNITNLTELKDYIFDLEVISTNEKSEQIAALVKEKIKDFGDIADNFTLFKLYWILFHQSFYFVNNMKQTEDLLENMKQIVERTNSIEHQASLYVVEALYFQMIGDQNKAIETISKGMKFVDPHKDSLSEIYYSTLYTHTLFHFFNDKQYSRAIKGMTECLDYYYARSSNMSGLVKSINNLLQYYTLLGKERETNDLLHWILVQEKIQDKLIDSHYVLLYVYLGTISLIRYRVDDAISYLSKTHTRIKDTNSEKEQMYEYVEVLKLLCRSFAYNGEFQKSYDIILELLNFIETDFVKDNYLEWKLKRIYFAIYYSLLFVFAQLDAKIDDLDDLKLTRVYKYIKELIEKSRLPEDLLLNTSLNEEEVKQLAKERDVNPDEFNLSVHQQLISLEAHKASEETVEKIQAIRSYVYSPLYADILLGKIHLSMGNFKEFKDIFERIKQTKDTTISPIMLSWINLFKLLNDYLSNSDKKDIIDELESLKRECNENNFYKMVDEINLYQKLIGSTKTFTYLKDRFNQTAFTDIYTAQSKKLVLESLENETLS